jgi:recombination protein RecR
MSGKFTPSLDKLIKEFARFPGIGPKSAEKLALFLLSYTKDEIENLREAIRDVKYKTKFCKECFSLTEKDLCDICSDPRRSREIICVVESFKDVLSIEKTSEYRGLYHVLGGHIAPLDGVGPEDLKIVELLRRIDHYKQTEMNPVEELILATNPNVDGDATSMYIARQVRKRFPNIKITRIARGLPIGGDLEFADPLTLSRAIQGRGDFDS